MALPKEPNSTTRRPTEVVEVSMRSYDIVEYGNIETRTSNHFVGFRCSPLGPTELKSEDFTKCPFWSQYSFVFIRSKAYMSLFL